VDFCIFFIIVFFFGGPMPYIRKYEFKQDIIIVIWIFSGSEWELSHIFNFNIFFNVDLKHSRTIRTRRFFQISSLAI